MAERFTLNEHGEAIPYVAPVIEDDASAPSKPQCKYKVGDKVTFVGQVTEIFHAQGDMFVIRVQSGNCTLRMSQAELDAIQPPIQQEALSLPAASSVTVSDAPVLETKQLPRRGRPVKVQVKS